MSTALAERNEEIRGLSAAGVSKNQIAGRFGITRQRVSQIIGTLPDVPARPVYLAVRATGTPLKALAERYAETYGVTATAAYRLLLETGWRPRMRLSTADRILVLIDRMDLLGAS